MTDGVFASPESAAAIWLARLADGADARTRAEFEVWCQADPGNVEAFDRISATQNRLTAFAETEEILSLRQQTLARVTRSRKVRSATGSGLALAIPMLLAGLVFGMHAWRSAEPVPQMAAANPTGQVFTTVVGQRMALNLEDGSKVSLNTATRLRIAYGPSERRLVLEEGQAWFEVAHDLKRPFVVFAGGQRVEAHGTIFDVWTSPRRTEVMLAQGRVTVAVSARGGASTKVAMNPHDLLVASPSGTSVRRVRDLSKWQSWREGRVVFDDVPLSEAIAEMNRYSTVQLVVDDERTARIRLSGSFNAGATQAFLDALALGFRVEGRYRDRVTIVLQRK